MVANMPFLMCFAGVFAEKWAYLYKAQQKPQVSSTDIVLFVLNILFFISINSFCNDSNVPDINRFGGLDP